MQTRLKSFFSRFPIKFIVLVTISFCFIVLASKEFLKRYETPTNQFSYNVTSKSNNSTELDPVTLKIEKASIEIPIIKSHKVWEEDAKSAVYFSKTPIPGNQGNSVIYGHNFPKILGKLNKVSKGDVITIVFTNGSEKNFKVIQKVNVSADQTHTLGQTQDTRLTIYTCSGVLDIERLVVIAVAI